MTSTPREGYFWLPTPGREHLYLDPRKSVDHETNDRVMVHGEGTRADGRRSGSGAKYSQILGSRPATRASRSLGPEQCSTHQAGYLARPTTKRLKRKFISQLTVWGQFSARVAAVVRGERASRSIVNRTTALWSIWMVSSLILAGPLICPLRHNVGSMRIARL